MDLDDIANRQPDCPRPLPQGLALFSVDLQGSIKHLLVFAAAPESAFAKGIIGEAIVGEVDSSLSVTPEHFRENSVFNQLLHHVIADEVPNLPEVQQEGRSIGDGSLFVIDARVDDPNGAVSTEDILGGFGVKNGRIVDGSYQRNPNHRLLSDKGLFRLHPAVQAALLKRLDKLHGLR